jgi:hypothetical protein
MTTIQRFFLAVLPRRLGQAMEKESRLWTLRCLTCGSETSVWDNGGIRYLAAGRPRNLKSCPTCSRVTWHETYKRDRYPDASS